MSDLQTCYRYHRAYGQPAPLALKLARTDVAMKKSRYPSERCNPWNPRFSAYGENHLRWIEDTSRAGLRFVGFADKILPRAIDHRGWFTNSFQDETYRGAVYQLPARHGEQVYAYGYNDPCNLGAALLSFDAAGYRQADVYAVARWADDVARRAAEQERNYQEASDARQRYEDAGAELASLRNKLLNLCHELRQNRSLPDTICATLRESITMKLAQRAELRKERAELAATYGTADGWQY